MTDMSVWQLFWLGSGAFTFLGMLMCHAERREFADRPIRMACNVLLLFSLGPVGLLAYLYILGEALEASTFDGIEFGEREEVRNYIAIIGISVALFSIGWWGLPWLYRWVTSFF